MKNETHTARSTNQIHLTRRSPHYWRVTFDHPPLNIFGPETIPQLNEIVTALETDEHVKVVVFDSAVQGFFLTHYDFLAKAQETTSLPTRKWSDSGKCLLLNGGAGGARTPRLVAARPTTVLNLFVAIRVARHR